VKIALFCEAYPAIRLKYVAPDGSDYDTNRPHRNGYPRKWADPFPRKCLDYREKAVERLQRAIALSPISVSVMAGIIGVSENVVRYVTDGVHLPHPKTARLIHEYLDSIELETKSA
jgi:ribosome-binding protein aMBF1 (putative translation factor)